jgi:hypothetical protein
VVADHQSGRHQGGVNVGADGVPRSRHKSIWSRMLQCAVHVGDGSIASCRAFDRHGGSTPTTRPTGRQRVLPGRATTGRSKPLLLALMLRSVIRELPSGRAEILDHCNAQPACRRLANLYLSIAALVAALLSTYLWRLAHDDCETSPPQTISASGSGCCRDPGGIADCKGASLSDSSSAHYRPLSRWRGY